MGREELRSYSASGGQKVIKCSFAIFPILAVLAASANAETMGSSSVLDKRIQTAVYSSDQVYRVQAAIGRVSLITFPPSETVNGVDGLIISGDPGAWEMGVNKSGTMVGLKPKSEFDPDTNFTINTNKNTYFIEMRLVKSIKDMTIALKFKHPDPVKKPEPVKPNVPAEQCAGVWSGPYQKRGSKDVAPIEGWDNGMHTCFRFANNTARPVVYQVLPDGTETLANVQPVDDVLVVYSVSKIFRFRLNGLVAEARPTQQLNMNYNFKGTTTGEVREVRRVGQ